MKYAVGQVLYVIPAKQATVYPMQVIEEVTKRSLSGEVETLYMLQGGPGTKGVMRLDEITGEIFDSADVVYKTLISRVTQQIGKVVESAVKKSQEWFEQVEVTQQTTKNESVQLPTPRRQEQLSEPVSTNDSTVIDLGDGMIAKVRLPEGFK